MNNEEKNIDQEQTTNSSMENKQDEIASMNQEETVNDQQQPQTEIRRKIISVSNPYHSTIEYTDSAHSSNASADVEIKSATHKKHPVYYFLLIGGIVTLSLTSGIVGAYLTSGQKQDANQPVFYQNVNSSKQDAVAGSVSDVANKTMNSVVEVRTEIQNNNSYFQQYVEEGAGSGVILSQDGYIVTNHHVIQNATKITVYTKDGQSYSAKLVGTNADEDLAVLKIEATNLTPAVIGSSGNMKVGDMVVAIGNPLGELGGTVTDGIVSALDREIQIDNKAMTLLQTNAQINPGNSGGGLFNAQGELIGIVNAKSGGTNIEGLGFAIPIDHAKDIIEDLIANGKPTITKPKLGISINVDETGVIIESIDPNGVARIAGLKSGDKIITINKTAIQDIADISKILNRAKAGDSLLFEIERNQKTIEITVVLK